MKSVIQIKNQKYNVDLSKPLDISIPLEASGQNLGAWYLDKPTFEPVKMDDWVGSVKKGASVNFNNISFNPHAHGTHTECVGHISKEFYSVNNALIQFFYLAELISVTPEIRDDDLVILASEIEGLLAGKQPEALVIRTLPNISEKKTMKYSNTNWPYLEEEAANYIREIGVSHLLIDLPSVDKEKDDGKLLAHKAFWNFPNSTRFDATITEFIYVPDHIEDGSYLLDLQIAPFENDATPSKPILYKFLEL